MTWDLINTLNTFSTIWANFVTIITWIVALFAFIFTFKYFVGKKYKAIVISSKTFQIPLEKEDIMRAIYPSKIYDETIDFTYDKTITTPINFYNQNLWILSEIKSKYNPICVFWISEMFIPLLIWYYLQDNIHIEWFRKLKEDIIKFSWNPWSRPSILSLKWFLWLKWIKKSLLNKYNTPEININQWDEINLIVKISYDINLSNIPEELKNKENIIFWLNKTDPSFLINRSQIFTFSKNIKEVLHKIDQQIWNNWKINIFSTLPIPFCIKLWQNIHRNWPEVVFYDFNRSTNKYEKVISTKDIII